MTLPVDASHSELAKRHTKCGNCGVNVNDSDVSIQSLRLKLRARQRNSKVATNIEKMLGLLTIIYLIAKSIDDFYETVPLFWLC